MRSPSQKGKMDKNRKKSFDLGVLIVGFPLREGVFSG